jgi:hypothetical protein
LKRYEYKYEGREDLGAVTLLEFAKRWEVRGDSVRRRVRAAERVVGVFPRFNREQGSPIPMLFGGAQKFIGIRGILSIFWTVRMRASTTTLRMLVSSPTRVLSLRSPNLPRGRGATTGG